MEPITDLDVASTMVRCGGSFVSSLGGAWLRADPINAAKLKAAFPAEWDRYRELAALQAERRKANA